MPELDLNDFTDPQAEEAAGSAMESIEQAALPGLVLGGTADAGPSAQKASQSDDQDSLQALQKRQLRDEHPLRVAYLKAQADITQLQRISQRLRIVSQACIAVLACLLGISVLVLVVEAMRSRAIVIREFSTPPRLADRGLSGRVVASSLLDELTLLQSSTRSRLEKRKVSDAWTNQIELELPSTGISIQDLENLLRQRLGHDLTVSGDLVQSSNGKLILTVRGEMIPARSFNDDNNDIKELTRDAAEYIFEHTQPSLYVSSLIAKGESEAAVAFSKRAFPSTSEADRPYLLNQWANALQNIRQPAKDSLFLYGKALALKKDFGNVHNNIMLTTVVMGKEQEAWEYGKKHLQRQGGRATTRKELGSGQWNQLTWNLQAWRAVLADDALQYQGIGSGNQLRHPVIALIDTRLHDLDGARFHLSLGSGTSSDSTIKARSHFVRGRIAALTGNTTVALREMESFKSEYERKGTVSANMPGYLCWVALAQEEAGRPQEADQTLREAGRYVNCLRFKGDILDRRGDWENAQLAYAESVRMAPDLPAGYYSWGVALARHGQTKAAMEKLAAAAKRGPGWADPLKAWGDCLASHGQWNAALKKYQAASRLAPEWAGLKQALYEAKAHRYIPRRQPLGL
ncbi:Tetratricopeptide repeat family protein [Cyanobium sp. Copco_Reservoir_LC18]|uniref:tetratricopeptide repeat protein n=1 Tax=Cyanobium sp. Copco_Reservoir_LC18 TaxID=1328305 RepID=UPI0013569D73|nr:tetratricopeptide repeat protein [Cyanobium sp. Copco_Reservoir_LC18]KAF0654996.1 Tetratricopeptide repeat family protein [Cyanobium sp. Copco_Reservoir_LC18]